MNDNNKRIDQDNQNQLALYAAKLAVVAEAINTLGDTISTISAIIALEAERQEQNKQDNDKKDNKYMQKQINYLINEIEKLKIQVNKQSHRRK